MRMTEFFAYVNEEMPKGYVPYHLDISTIKHNKEVKAFKRAIKKQKKEEEKTANQGRRDGTEDIDIFGDD